MTPTDDATAEASAPARSPSRGSSGGYLLRENPPKVEKLDPSSSKAPMAKVLTASVTVAPTPLFEALLSLTPPRVETLRLRRMGVWYQALVR